jgi:uncharacterized 2Fe-2S/4Fe-4S cluster protein (DUF4445 family)
MPLDSQYSLALDLGTTTLAGWLCDNQGHILARQRTANPQAALAADIVSRLDLARAGRGVELRQVLADGVETLIAALLRDAGVPRTRIGRAALAANPGITHLLAGQPVDSLIFPPHRPVFRGGEFLSAGQLAIDLPCDIFLFPLVSGYVGGDLAAFLFGVESVRPGTLFVDIGTNAEIALFDGRQWRVTSVAAGPAFEGGEIACGMPWKEGAVDDVQVVDDRLQLHVVEGGLPRGLCGSGLLAAVAAGLESGLIAADGTLVPPGAIETNLSRYLREDGEGRALLLYRDAHTELVLSQDDIRAFQLAKGAVKAGIACLLQKAGVAEEEVGDVILTGSFGASLQRKTLKKVAMLPENMVEKVRFEAEGVLRGVRRFLILEEGEQAIGKLAASLHPYPLSGTPAFEKAFIAALNF